MGLFLLSQDEQEIVNPPRQLQQRPCAQHPTPSRGNPQQIAVITITTTSTGQLQTKIVQPWLINRVFTDGYDAGQMYRLLVR